MPLRDGPTVSVSRGSNFDYVYSISSTHHLSTDRAPLPPCPHMPLTSRFCSGAAQVHKRTSPAFLRASSWVSVKNGSTLESITLPNSLMKPRFLLLARHLKPYLKHCHPKTPKICWSRLVYTTYSISYWPCYTVLSQWRA